MAIREWWDDSQIYWIEVTDRSDLGANLLAPKVSHSGLPTPSYTLVSHVKPGDVVFHWWKQGSGEPGFVARSVASSPAVDSWIDWQARGTYGRKAGEDTEGREAWLVALEAYEELRDVVTLSDVRDGEEAVRQVRNELQDLHGSPLYFPFAISEKRPIRTAQGYLFKLPAELVDVLGLDSPVPRKPDAPRRKRKPVDAALRKAIERHAVEAALAHLDELDFTTLDVGDVESYDIDATAPDGQHFFVEVKGSSSDASTVNLTANEVQLTSAGKSVLFVIDRIDWSRDSAGQIRTSGGRLRVWWTWTPAPESLLATEYRYVLPSDDDSVG